MKSHGSGMITLACNVSGWFLVRSTNVIPWSVNGVALVLEKRK
jgi:hypothetical protein